MPWGVGVTEKKLYHMKCRLCGKREEWSGGPTSSMAGLIICTCNLKLEVAAIPCPLELKSKENQTLISAKALCTTGPDLTYRPTDQARPCLTKGDWREGAVAFPETHQTLS